MKKQPWQEVLSSTVGICGGIGGISIITYLTGYPLLIASFGASAVLLYAAPNAPMAQPKNLFCGHGIASFIGALCYLAMGETWYSITIAVTAAILLMMFTGTLHPPGGATAIVTVLSHGNFMFILFPVLLGAAILFVVAFLANKISPYRTYPNPDAMS